MGIVCVFVLAALTGWGAISASPPQQPPEKTVKVEPAPGFGAKVAWDSIFKPTIDAGMTFLPDGGFVRTSDAEGKVYVFGPDGNLVKTFGRPGQGPGDLQRPGGVALLDGGEIVINDAGNRRLSVFDARGNPFKIMKTGNAPGGNLPIVSMTALAGKKVAYAVLDESSSTDAAIVRLYRVRIIDLETEVETEIAVFRWERPRPKFFVRVMSWEPRVVLARVGPDRLLAAYSGEPAVSMFSLDGKKIGSFSTGVTPVRITWKHLERQFGGPDAKGFDFMVKNKADIRLPEFLPCWRNLEVTPEGVVVFDMNEARFSDDVSFSLLSFEGKPLGSAKLDFGPFEPTSAIRVHQGFGYAFLSKKDGDGSFVLARFKMM